MNQAGRSPTRAVWFLAGLGVVIAILAFMYVTPSSKQDEPVDIPQDQDPHTEIQMLEAMWKEHPDHAPIALQLGNLYSEEGAHPLAISYYREFLKLDTSSTGGEVRLDISRSLYAMGRMDEAKREVRELLKRDPFHAGGLYNMGAIMANTNQNDSARFYWERLIAKHPEDTLAVFAKQSLGMLGK